MKILTRERYVARIYQEKGPVFTVVRYEGWNFNSGNYLFTTDTRA